MRRLLKNRLALSTVVTTLIILVVSVLLAGVVTYFAINVTSTRVQEESVHITKHHVWHNSSSGVSLASLLVINTGGRDIVLDKISVRGQVCPWNDTGNTGASTDKFVLYVTTNNPVSADLEFTQVFKSTYNSTQNQLTIGDTAYNFTVAPDDLVLGSGYSMIIYMVNPDSISINDIGLTVSIELFTAQAMYYREANVQAKS